MRKRLTLFIAVAFAVTGCVGSADDDASFSYKLLRLRNGEESSTLHAMPDGALIAVSKRLERPRQIWHLRRVAGWDAPQPHEDQLDVDVGPNSELLGWAHQEDRYDPDDQLLMDPGGNYLVVRLSQNADTWNQNPHESAKPLQSVLNIIDLHAFRLLRRVVVTDPLLAAGDMGFSPKGEFVVSGLEEHKGTTSAGNFSDTGQYAVETLTLPDLRPEAVCSYTLVNNSYSPQASSTPEGRKRIQEENRAEDARRQDESQAADDACRSELSLLGFSSLDDVRKHFNSFEMRVYTAEHSSSVPPQSPWGCDFENLSGDLKYALFDCDEGRAHVTFFSGYRGFRVFGLKDGKQLMDLKLPRGGEYSGVIAASRGVSHAVLLRDGAELKGYRIQ